MSTATIRDAIASISGTVERLSQLSQDKYSNPYTSLTWPGTIDPENVWFFSPEHVSLHGTRYWDQLDDTAQHRLAFEEAANFFSLNIHGEKLAIEGLATRLYRPDLAEISGYLHHFLDEENKHSIYFGGFCQRYAKVYRSLNVPFGGKLGREIDDLLFFAQVMLFEEHSDWYNVHQAKDSRLDPLAVFINAAHHADESRHLVFNRAIVQAFWDTYRAGWDEATVAGIRAQLAQFLNATWREYYNPDVYATVGFADPWQVAEDAWASPVQRARRRRVSAKCLRFLSKIDLLPEEPTDVF
ncbi:hypothetical protein GCM10022223_14950 [Kineosporia mesophila]|uniref:Para-aminobenzoate N-oxygenase AurF n=1 Tax=Kineosporia mesophila TaxID=566012 RepID=A0ABP6Z6Z5_9ACTN|nr:diiron oxygenase [Kineosporia mesophila]MCD5352971.1 diiron oxygenase [Kineosporia mesophila]